MRETTKRFFDEEEEWTEAGARDAPLAERMRPRTLDEFVGQERAVGLQTLVRRALERGEHPGSIILWGPPGSGKTTLARLLGGAGKGKFIALSAVAAGVKEVREVLDLARRGKSRTTLFIDEIHRFNKAQQDALLGAVEDGTITLIGATTENPSFEVNSALLSRCRVLILEPLGREHIAIILNRAIADQERGMARWRPVLEDGLIEKLAGWAEGDARVALATLEQAVLAAAPAPDGTRLVDSTLMAEGLGRARYAYDRQGEDHYNLVSALIKSTRNSDERAALYWLARLIEGGADPMFIARRLCILASEDVGLADPGALVQAAAAAQITHLVGLPEAHYALAQATIYLARAAKSNEVGRAYGKAVEDAARTPRAPVPMHLRNAVTTFMKQVGYGQGYHSIHDEPAAAAKMSCLPRELLENEPSRTIPDPPDGDPARDPQHSCRSSGTRLFARSPTWRCPLPSAPNLVPGSALSRARPGRPA